MCHLAAGHPAAPPDSGRYTTVRLAQPGRPLAGLLLTEYKFQPIDLHLPKVGH